MCETHNPTRRGERRESALAGCPGLVSLGNSLTGAVDVRGTSEGMPSGASLTLGTVVSVRSGFSVAATGIRGGSAGPFASSDAGKTAKDSNIHESMSIARRVRLLHIDQPPTYSIGGWG